MKTLIYSISIILLFSCKPSETASNDIKESAPVVKENDANMEIETSLSIPVIEIAAGTNGGFETTERKIITNQEELNAVWSKAYSRYLNKIEAPEIDFNQFNVAMVAMGMRNSGGHNIKVLGINTKKGGQTIIVEETSPGEGCMTTEAITFPYQIVQFKKISDTPYDFENTARIINCDSK